MLVLSRESGFSIIVKTELEHTILTVRGINRWTRSIGLEIRQKYLSKGDIIEFTLGQRFLLTDTIEIWLVDVQDGKCRLGIVAPPDVFVSRYESTDPCDDDGSAPAPVPRPSSPKPPTLNVQLDVPTADED